jgi:hypothetical protein
MSALELPDVILFDLWCHILKIDLSPERYAAYQLLRLLWKEIPMCEWMRHSALRKVVRLIEDDMPSVTMESPAIARLPFDVLMSCMF